MKMVPARCDGLRVFLRLKRLDEKKRNVVCTHSTDATDQDVEGTCSTASKDKYLPQSQVLESTPAGSEDDLTSGSDGG